MGMKRRWGEIQRHQGQRRFLVRKVGRVALQFLQEGATSLPGDGSPRHSFDGRSEESPTPQGLSGPALPAGPPCQPRSHLQKQGPVRRPRLPVTTHSTPKGHYRHGERGTQLHWVNQQSGSPHLTPTPKVLPRMHSISH